MTSWAAVSVELLEHVIGQRISRQDHQFLELLLWIFATLLALYIASRIFEK